MMKNTNQKSLIVLFMILIAGAAILYRNVLSSPAPAAVSEAEVTASAKVEEMLQELDSINFDLAIFNDARFAELQSIETPLASVPVGRDDPFAPIFGR